MATASVVTRTKREGEVKVVERCTHFEPGGPKGGVALNFSIEVDDIHLDIDRKEAFKLVKELSKMLNR